MRKCFFIVFIISISIKIDYLFAQQSIVTKFKLAKQLILPVEGYDPFDYMISYNDNKLYATIKPSFEIKKEQRISFFCIDNKRCLEIKIKLHNDDWLINFTVNNDDLYILGQYYVYHFGGILNYKPKLIKKFQIDDMYKSIYYFNRKICLLKSCFSCFEQNTKAYIIDLKKNTVSSHIFESPIGFPLTYFQPRRIISFFKNSILVSDITKYQVRIYDTKFQLISEFRRPSIDWDKDSNVNFNKKLTQLKTLKDLLKYGVYFTEATDKYYTIVNVDFLDDTTILVCYSTSLKSKDISFEFYFDIWKKNDKGLWYLTEKDLQDSKQKPESKFNYDDLSSFYGQYFIFEKTIITVNDLPFYINNLDLKNITFSEIYQKKNNYYKKNDIKTSFFIYELKGIE